MSKHTTQELQYKQALPLEIKVSMSKQRIREWVKEFGVDGVYVSFSGGKDSTVLLHLVRELYPNVPAVFCDTGLEYPEIREFVKTFDNVEWLKPKKTFKQVIDTYGYPFISKEVSAAVYTAKHFIENADEYATKKPLPVQNPDEPYKPYALLRLEGKIGENGKGNAKFNCKKWHFMLDAPYYFSHRCCDVMKKAPFREYQKRTGRVPFTGQMAYESGLRKTNWLKYGCNAFDRYEPMSNPLSIWTEQDVLRYIKEHNIKIASVYGDVVCAYEEPTRESALIAAQTKLITTGLDRTGCMFCGYGCHLEKGEGRFCKMKKTHPKQYEYIMKPWDEGGLGYKDILDWLNEHGNLNIKY